MDDRERWKRLPAALRFISPHSGGGAALMEDAADAIEFLFAEVGASHQLQQKNNAESLLRDIYSYAEDQGMETLMDMIDAFSTTVRESVAP